jgi:hypothetical protein
LKHELPVEFSDYITLLHAGSGLHGILEEEHEFAHAATTGATTTTAAYQRAGSAA